MKSLRVLIAAALLVPTVVGGTPVVGTETDLGTHILYVGTAGTNAGDVVFESAVDFSRHSACYLFSTAGSVEVLVSLNGTTFASSALALESKGDTDGSSVLATTANKIYGFVAKFRKVRVKQVGATAANVHMTCWRSKSEV